MVRYGVEHCSFLLRITVEGRNVKTYVNFFGSICFELYLGDLYVIAA
jgi:hypothetical protein